MSRTSIVMSLPSNYSATMSNPPSRGSDWGDTVLAPGTQIPAGSPRVLLASIGDPGVVESDHWGWIYVTLTPAGGGIPVKVQLYIYESHSDIKRFELGYFDDRSSKDNPMPLGTFGTAVIEHEAPGGTVLYTVPSSVAAR